MTRHSTRTAATESRARNHASTAAGASLVNIIARALDARREILIRPDLNAVRVLNGMADGVDGLILDQYADVLVAQLHLGRLRVPRGAAMALCREALEARHGRAVYLKVFPKDRSAGPGRKEATGRMHREEATGRLGAAGDVDAQNRDPVPWIGEGIEPEITVVENGVKFIVRPYDGYSTGLFLDHRDNRTRVREMAAGRRVLNAFSYTCGFSIAAALGKAASTVSVDVSKKALEWGKRNFTANSLPVTPHDSSSPAHTFICSDIFEYIRRAVRQQRQFDLMILDPPSFARAGKSGGGRPARTFSIAADLDALLRSAVGLLAAGGVLILSCNHRPLSLRAMEAAVRHAASPRRTEVVSRPALPLDFRGDPDFAKSIIVRVD